MPTVPVSKAIVLLWGEFKYDKLQPSTTANVYEVLPLNPVVVQVVDVRDVRGAPTHATNADGTLVVVDA
jgi:phage portal protein BeeE